MDDLLQRIEEWSEEISFYKSQNDPEAQLELLSEGIKEMSEELASLESEEPLTDYLRNRRNEIAKHLADFYGRRGGLFRRMNRLDESQDCYRCGAAIETSEEYAVTNSYNTTNAIVLELLIHPEGLTDLQADIDQARQLVKKHVAGTRRHSCWAWADLGLLHLIAGEREEGIHAFHQALETQYPPWAMESTISVLKECSEKLSTPHPEITKSLTETIDILSSMKDRR